MIAVNCYNCRSSESDFYIRENGFDLVKCRGCGLLYIPKRPDEAAIETATAIGQHHGDKTLDANVRYNPSVKALYLRWLAEIYPEGFDKFSSWLDVGCGYGEFIETLISVSRGRMSVVGSEPNIVKQKSAQQRGLDVSYFDIFNSERRFDTVSLLNVYSHLPDPREFIDALKRSVNPGGELLIQTGDAAEMSPQDILKPLSLPDHLSFTSERIIVPMLESMGLEVVSVTKFPNLPIEFRAIAKEIAKLFVPGKDSMIRYYSKWWKYQSTNMFVRARVPAI